jgi:hypothetical protein
MLRLLKRKASEPDRPDERNKSQENENHKLRKNVWKSKRTIMLLAALLACVGYAGYDHLSNNPNMDSIGTAESVSPKIKSNLFVPPVGDSTKQSPSAHVTQSPAMPQAPLAAKKPASGSQKQVPNQVVNTNRLEAQENAKTATDPTSAETQQAPPLHVATANPSETGAASAKSLETESENQGNEEIAPPLDPADSGRRLFDLQYQVRLKKLQLEIAKLDAEIAKERMKTMPPEDKNEEEDSTAVEPPENPVPAPLYQQQILGALSNVGTPGIGTANDGGQENNPLRLTALTSESAVIGGRVVRIGGIVQGMKVVKIDPRRGTVTLQSPFGEMEIGM